MKSSLITLLTFLLFSSAHAKDLPVETAILTDAPMVPPVITRTEPALVKVEIEVIEKVGKLADGVDYTFWTFGGSVPGKFIRVRVGDTVEFTLKNNASSVVPHNIDLHAVTGPGGGAKATATAPGQKSKFTFKAINSGLYIYHCATAPVGMHVANGMYGLIYVQPETPLPPVDHEYYVVQGDFYTKGKTGEKGLQAFSQDKAVDEKPTYVVFNGAQGSLTGDKALKAKVGESVRLFIGNGGPNLISSFHVIGEIFDKVYNEGGTKFNENVQTTLVPAGGSSIVDFKLNTNGTFLLVDHSLFRTFHKGTLGMLNVEGAGDPSIFKAETAPALATPSEEAHPEAKPEVKEEKKLPEVTKALSGKEFYNKKCSVCHGEDGSGVEGQIPPLAKSDFFKAMANKKDRTELISLPIIGRKGSIVVNKKEYNGKMPPVLDISDRDVAEVLNYVGKSWGNKARKFTVEEVKKARATLGAVASE